MLAECILGCVYETLCQHVVNSCRLSQVSLCATQGQCTVAGGTLCAVDFSMGQTDQERKLCTVFSQSTVFQGTGENDR
jgi:hypothetical protein